MTPDIITWCLHEALEHDLPPVHFPAKEIRGVTRKAFDRRPHHVDHAIEVHAWNQAWANTSLGMGGMAGQAITHAMTTVVIDTWAQVACVYVNRHLRGRVKVDGEWMQALNERRIITGRLPIGEPA